LLAL
ncbi:pyridine nucleotide-disulfide oxidoreductase family protein, partial [Vibrio parahaemolyticus V-223/04]|jgi:hypothetical protein